MRACPTCPAADPRRKSLGRVEMAAAAVAVAPTAPPPEPAEAAAHRRSAGGAEDAAFFPGLVGTVAALTERLEKILEEGGRCWARGASPHSQS